MFGVNTNTQDGNANAPIDPPALRVTPRDAVTKRVKTESPTLLGARALGNSLGNVIAGFVEDNKKTTQEALLQESVARQGLNKAVNAEDEKLKRTGWGLQLYGQNPQYAIAQELAVQNQITDKAMKFEAEIDKFTTVHPDEFRDRVLSQELSTMLEPFANDPEMRQKLTSSWMKRVPSLVKHQYQSWYANSQQQAYQGAKESILKEADYWNQRMNTALANGDTEELATLHVESEQFIRNGKRPDMSDDAWENALVESTQVSLANGNKNLYDRVKQMGLLEKWKPQSVAKVRAGINEYDPNSERQVNTLWTDFEEDLYSLDDVNDGYAVIDDFREQLKALEKRSSGTERAQLAYQRGERNAARWDKRIDRELKAGLTKIAKQQVEREQKQELVDSFGKPALDRESYQAVHTAKDVKEAFDSYLIGSIGDEFGVEATEPELVMADVIRDPAKASFLAKKLKDQTVESPMVKNVLGAFSSGWKNLYVGEDGGFSEDGLRMYQSMKTLKKEGVLDRYLSSPQMKDTDFIMTRLEVGMPVSAIEKDLISWKQSQTQPKSSVVQLEKESKYDAELRHVNTLVQNIRKDSLSKGDQVKLRERFMEGLQIYNNDTDKATEYVKTRFINEATIINGNMIYPSDAVKNFYVQLDGKDSSYSLETVLKNAKTLDLLTPFVDQGQGTPRGKNAGVGISDLNISIHAQPDDDGIYIDAPSFSMAQYIPREVLEEWATALAKDKNSKNAVSAAELLRRTEQERNSKIPKY